MTFPAVRICASPLTHACLIVLACALLYAGTLNTPFVFDGVASIEQNSRIKLTTLDPQRLFDAAFGGHPRVRPVTNASFALNYYFGRLDVRGYHAVNIAIHAINGLLVYAVALMLLGRFHAGVAAPGSGIPLVYVALFAALLFVCHPIQTQSVTYLYQRATGLASMFYLAALALYLRGRLATITWRRVALWTGGVVCWGLALGSKQIAGTLPLIVFLVEWYFFQDASGRWLKRHLGYLVLIAAAIYALAYVYLGDSPLSRVLAGYAIRDFTPVERILSEFRAVVLYIGLVLYPHPSRLTLLHDFEVSHSLLQPASTLFAILAIAALVALAFALTCRHRLASFCILWFLVNLAMESSIIPLELVFEHRLYLPMVGLALLASHLMLVSAPGLIGGAVSRAGVSVVGVVMVATLCVATVTRNTQWTDALTLWTDVVQKNPESFRARVNLGAAYRSAGDLTRAAEEYRRALTLTPRYNVDFNVAKAHSNLGQVLYAQGNLPAAEEQFRIALRLAPNYPRLFNAYGALLAREARYAEAITWFSKAIARDPFYTDAHYNLGMALIGTSELSAALQQLSEALRIEPEHAGAHHGIAMVLSEQGKTEAAIDHLQTTMSLDPGNQPARYDLGVLLLRAGRSEAAAEQLSRLLEAEPDHAGAHYYLGHALADAGREKAACHHYAEALRLRPDNAAARARQEACVARAGSLSDAASVTQ